MLDDGLLDVFIFYYFILGLILLTELFISSINNLYYLQNWVVLFRYFCRIFLESTSLGVCFTRNPNFIEYCSEIFSIAKLFPLFLASSSFHTRVSLGLCSFWWVFFIKPFHKSTVWLYSHYSVQYFLFSTSHLVHAK